MPQNVTIGAFVLGAVLLLIALLAGGFKIFSVEIRGRTGPLQRIVAGVLGILLIIVGLSGYFPHSCGSAKPVSLAFENRLMEPVLVYWIDQGREKLQQEIFPGNTYHVDTYVTHQWRVRSKKTGEEIMTYVVRSTGGVVTIPPSR